MCSSCLHACTDLYLEEDEDCMVSTMYCKMRGGHGLRFVPAKTNPVVNIERWEEFVQVRCS